MIIYIKISSQLKGKEKEIMIVLVINCGSSSIKYQLFDMPEKKVLAKGIVERIGLEMGSLTHKVADTKHQFEKPIPDHHVGMDLILAALVDKDHGVIKDIHEIKAVGHRVVHGGEKYNKSVIINEEVINGIKDVTDLAPLHNPANLIGIEAAEKALGEDTKMVAVFDTAYHQTIPQHAYLYPLPYKLYKDHKVRKYGFHGTSHNFVMKRTSELLGIPEHQISMIVCHLGNGGSITAIKDGKSIDTTMGLTPLPGVMMGTRCGDIDPAIAFYLLEQGICKDYKEVDKMFNKESGILGISETTSDMRDIEDAAAEEGPDSRAQLVLDLFSYRVKLFIGAYMAVLDRVDAIAFTGGIGENGPIIRWAACDSLANLGVKLDPIKNKETWRGKEGEISSPNSSVKVMVVPTDEEGFIASDTYRLVR